jgi:tetratricopeptide (TPR) repeat protein
MWEAMSQGQGYAGDAGNPRPVRPRSLYDLKKWMADYFPYARYRGAFPEDTLYFAFCYDRMQMPIEEAIPIPREHLWWLAAPGDSLLLSDRRTHHYIRVQYVDSDADRIYLLDPWPDRVFLKKGLNATGVEAVVEPFGPKGSDVGSLKRISITRSEFLRVILGIITKDTPDLIEHYLVQHPAQRDRFEIQLAFGLALMDAEAYVLARFAVVRFQAALCLAEVAEATERIEYAAARLYVALVAALHHQRWSGDALATKAFEDELRHLKERYSEDRLIARARVDELCSLSHAAGVSEDYAEARRFLDAAVSRFPDEEEPRRLRAKVRVLCQEYHGALDDVTQALAHNARRIRELEARHEARHPEDRHSRSDDEARIGGLKNTRFEELSVRVAALVNLSRLAEACAAAEELIAYAPDRSAGYAKLAVVERMLGNEAAALEHMRQAWEREHDPRMRAQMEVLLQAGSATAPPSHGTL